MPEERLYTTRVQRHVTGQLLFTDLGDILNSTLHVNRALGKCLHLVPYSVSSRGYPEGQPQHLGCRHQGTAVPNRVGSHHHDTALRTHFCNRFRRHQERDLSRNCKCPEQQKQGPGGKITAPRLYSLP